jgi:CxxC motif-containing protein
MTKLICIVCPNGCNLEIEKDGDQLIVKNNKCNRGITFATEEMTNPTRSVTSTCATIYPNIPVIPVRTKGDIPKGKMLELIQLINTLKIDRPYSLGEVLYANVLDTGVDLIVTTDMTKLLEVQK